MRPGRRKRIGYHDSRVPSPLGMPQTAERLAVMEAYAILKREPTADESKLSIGLAHLFSGRILDQDAQIARLEETVLELRRLAG